MGGAAVSAWVTVAAAGTAAGTTGSGAGACSTAAGTAGRDERLARVSGRAPAGRGRVAVTVIPTVRLTTAQRARLCRAPSRIAGRGPRPMAATASRTSAMTNTAQMA